jgi:AraC-like DNA-binding protein
MHEKKPFLRLRYSIHALADDINIPSYQLSAYLNRELGLNFTGYMNLFRVRYCKDLIQKGHIHRLNLKGLALACGFYNRNTLTTAFKRFTGFTPSYYQKRSFHPRRISKGDILP